MNNPLDPIMAWHELASQSLQITFRAIDQNIPNAIPPRSIFFEKPASASRDQIEAATSQIDDLVVLSLVSTFERSIREALTAMPRLASLPSTGDSIDARLRNKLVAALEYWRLSDEVLPIYAAQVDRNLVGQVKQAIDYRNWVAHGRSIDRPPGVNVTPQYAYRTLTAFLGQAGLL